MTGSLAQRMRGGARPTLRAGVPAAGVTPSEPKVKRLARWSSRPEHISALAFNVSDGAATGARMPSDGVAKKGAMPPAIDQPAFSERQDILPRDDQVIEHPDVTQCRSLFSVCVRNSSARDGSATPDGWLCTRINAAALSASDSLTTSRGYTDVWRLAHRAAEQFDVVDQRMLRVEHQHREHFMLQATEPDAQEVAHRLRRTQHLAAAQPLPEQLLRSLQLPVVLRGSVHACDIANDEDRRLDSRDRRTSSGKRRQMGSVRTKPLTACPYIGHVSRSSVPSAPCPTQLGKRMPNT